jgi:hypothetical protein
MQSSTLVSFEGSNGTDSVSFGGNLPIGPTPPTWLSASSLHWAPLQNYTATIDGVTSHLWSFSLGDGVGKLTIFDDAGNVLNSQDLLGTLQITDYWEFQTRWTVPGETLNLAWNASGKFAIVSPDSLETDPSVVPEAGSGILLGLGLAALFYIKKSASASRAFGRIRPGNPPSPPTV